MKIIVSEFQPGIIHHVLGSTFLGYLFLQVQFDCGFTLGLKNIAVRISRAGDYRIDFPSKSYKNAAGTTCWSPHYFTADKTSRVVLTQLVYSLPEVLPTLTQALGERAAKAA